MRYGQTNKVLIGILIVIIAVGAYQLLRPLPNLAPLGRTPPAPKTAAISLPWPPTGQAALGADGYSVLESNGVSQPASTASVAKVITALAVLQKKPLSPGGQGPTITLGQADVDYFNYYYSRGGSVANVSNGEQISEYQMLEAMLIPSANNMADSLARWAFGSTQAYISYANQMVKSMGLTQTQVNNTNGFDDTTTSTAPDLVKLGLAALKVPVISAVVSQKTASIPVEGQINNVNWLLGDDGIIGIKTGNTDKAGGCYLFAAKHQIQGRSIMLVGAVMGSPNLADAISAGKKLADSADAGFQTVRAITKGEILGSYHAPWGADSQLEAGRDINLMAWKGKDIAVTSDLVPAPAGAGAGASFGTVHVSSSGQTASSSLYLTKKISAPSLWWRLTRT